MLTGILPIAQDTYKSMIEFNVKSGGNMVVFGPSGVGKTEMPIQMAQELGYGVIYLNLSVLEAPDLLGLPMIDEATKTSVYAPPHFLPRKSDSLPKILILDEIDKSKPDIQNPLLELFQSRSINWTSFNIKSIIATANLPDENSHSRLLSHALMNRCSIYKLVPAFAPWANWAKLNNIHPLVVGYLSRHQDWLLKPNDSGDDTAYLHPSPRAWAGASKDLITAGDCDVSFQELVVSGRVGTPAAVAFKVWLEHYRHVDPYVKRLAEDGTFPDGEATSDLSRILVCAISAANTIRQECLNVDACLNEKTKEQLRQKLLKTCKNISKWMGGISTEFKIAAVKSTFDNDMIIKHKLVSVPEFYNLFTQIEKVLNW